MKVYRSKIETIFRSISEAYSQFNEEFWNDIWNDCVSFAPFFSTNKPVEQDLDSFIRTFRSQRAQSRMSNPSSDALISSSTNASADNAKSIRPLPTFSEHDIQKMKYKIDLG